MDRYNKEDFTDIVKKSTNLSDVANNLGLKPFCGNRSTIKKYINLYNIDVSHFKAKKKNSFDNKKPLNIILIENSTFNTTNLKKRLYDEGLKDRKCELCGQDENWNGKKMSLILDHINGVNNDHRIENLQIVCPNCNATLSTFSGKNSSKYNNIISNNIIKNKCSCGKIIDKKAKVCGTCYKINERTVERPSYEQLVLEISEFGYSGTGRKYGVSDTAIRKWLKYYKKNTPS